MKTYCKNVNVLDIGFISKCVFSCLEGKWARNDVAHFLSSYGKISITRVRKLVKSGEKYKLYWIVDVVSKEIRDNIKNKTIKLPPIQYSERLDGNSGKIRTIGTQSIIHQCYEYVAVTATMELFKKKIGVYQCASIPKRGQSYGKRAIEKWLTQDVNGTRYALKMDVKKCYPSIDQTKLKELLHRDLHKNSNLIYLLDTLIDMFDDGISIGSHLSQWLCNYYLSYAYHYISEKLFTTRNRKNGKKDNIRLISHVLFYMDDIIVFGSNKKYLMKAMDMIQDYFNNVLHLTIKPDWRLFKVQYIDKDKKSHGTFVDMMGFRFYRGKTSVRRSIFKRLRRKFIKINKKLKKHEHIPVCVAQSTMSYWGWIKNTNSYKFTKRYNAKHVVDISKRIISNNSKEENKKKVNGGK